MGHSESYAALSTAIVRVSTLGFQFVHFVKFKEAAEEQTITSRTNETWMKDYRACGESNTRLKSSGKAI